MNINFSVRGNALVVSVRGELDQHNASHLREQIDMRIAHTAVKRLVFDFSELDFMDSSGIGIIIGRYKLMRAVSGTVSIVNGKSSIGKILQLSGIRRIVKVYDTLSDALRTA